MCFAFSLYYPTRKEYLQVEKYGKEVYRMKNDIFTLVISLLPCAFAVLCYLRILQEGRGEK
jgi:hypothetical protein